MCMCRGEVSTCAEVKYSCCCTQLKPAELKPVPQLTAEGRNGPGVGGGGGGEYEYRGSPFAKAKSNSIMRCQRKLTKAPTRPTIWEGNPYSCTCT